MASIPESNPLQTAYNTLLSSSDREELGKAKRVFENAGVDFSRGILELQGHTYDLQAGARFPAIAAIAEKALHILDDKALGFEEVALNIVNNLSPHERTHYSSWIETLSKRLDECEGQLHLYQGDKGEASRLIEGALYASGRINKPLLLHNLKVHYGIDVLKNSADFITDGKSVSQTLPHSFPDECLDMSDINSRKKLQDYLTKTLKWQKEDPKRTIQKGNVIAPLVNGLHNICFRFFRLFEKLVVLLTRGPSHDFKAFKKELKELDEAFKSHLQVLNEVPEGEGFIEAIKKTLARGQFVIDRLAHTKAAHLQQDVKDALKALDEEIRSVSLKIEKTDDQSKLDSHIWYKYLHEALLVSFESTRPIIRPPSPGTLFQADDGENIV